MKRVMDYIGIALFFALVSILGIGSLVLRGGEGAAEVFSDLDDAQEQAETYVEESFLMHDNWTSLYSKAALVLGQRMFSGIYYDSDEDRLIDVFTESDYSEDKSQSSVNALNRFDEEHSELPCYVMLVPTASGIYSSSLPDSVDALDERQLIDDLYYDISAAVTPIDVWSALYSARDSYIYFRSDSRWTQLGAYEAYCTFASKLGLTTYTVSNYDVDYTHVDFYGELSQASGVKTTQADSINAYRSKYGSYIKSTEILSDTQSFVKTSVYSSSALITSDKYSYFLGDSDYKCVQIETTNEDSPSLLIIGSDYASCFAPLLSPHYLSITIVNPAELEDDDYLSDIISPDDYDAVLFLFDIESFCEGTGMDKINY